MFENYFWVYLRGMVFGLQMKRGSAEVCACSLRLYEKSIEKHLTECQISIMI